MINEYIRGTRGSRNREDIRSIVESLSPDETYLLCRGRVGNVYRNDGQYCSIITLVEKENGLPVCFCDLRKSNHDSGYIVIATRSGQQKKGYGKRLLARMIELAKENTGFRYLRYNIEPENYKSRALAESQGFVFTERDVGSGLDRSILLLR